MIQIDAPEDFVSPFQGEVVAPVEAVEGAGLSRVAVLTFAIRHPGWRVVIDDGARWRRGSRVAPVAVDWAAVPL